MKLSKKTLDIFKNFAKIANSIHNNEVGYLKTCESEKGGITAIAKIEEEFPDFSIFNLNELLNSISLFKLDSVDFEFQEDRIDVLCNNAKIKYYYSSPLQIRNKVPKKADRIINSKNVKYTSRFEISKQEIETIKKASNILGLGHIKITAKDGKCQIKIENIGYNNTVSNSYKTVVSSEGEDSSITINSKYFNMMENLNYLVEISDEYAIKFTCEDGILYYIIPQAVH